MCQKPEPPENDKATIQENEKPIQNKSSSQNKNKEQR